MREMEAMAVGLEETMELDMISHGPQFIAYMAGNWKSGESPWSHRPAG